MKKETLNIKIKEHKLKWNTTKEANKTINEDKIVPYDAQIELIKMKKQLDKMVNKK